MAESITVPVTEQQFPVKYIKFDAQRCLAIGGIAIMICSQITGGRKVNTISR